MSAWLITLFALWVFPVVSFFLIKYNRSWLQRRNLFLVCLAVNFVVLIGLVLSISTTLKEMDWILLTSLYLSVCILIWIAYFSGKLVIRIVSIIVMSFVFGAGYLSGSIGALGVGFVTSEFEPSVEKWLGDGIIYKETPLGNAVSDHRGKRVEIYRTLSSFPVLEWRVSMKKYQEYLPITISPLQVEYKPGAGHIYLSASLFSEVDRKQLYWKDTLIVKP